MIVWAGISSDDVDVTVEHYPKRVLPKRKMRTVSVPGRNGDLIEVEDAYENYNQPYDICIRTRKKGELYDKANAVAEWLLSPKGYNRLEDSYDINSFREAFFPDPAEFVNTLNRFGKATIQFVCKPQRFLRTGEQLIAASAATVLYNPSKFTALPEITVHGSGSGVLTVGDLSISISSITDGMILDSETENAYKDSANLNSAISAASFPTFGAGETAIGWTGGITSLSIKPRWWTI